MNVVDSLRESVRGSDDVRPVSYCRPQEMNMKNNTLQQLARNSNDAIEPTYTEADIKQFVAERDIALLSLDESRIRAHNRKWHVRTPDNPAVFWIGIHKARTACRSLPREARLFSQMWLTARGYKSMDFG